MTTRSDSSASARWARRLAAAFSDGNPVDGTNRTAAKAADLIDLGMIVAGHTTRGRRRVADVVFSMVTDDAALAAITYGPDGLLAGLAPGKLYVDMSTVSPQASRELAGAGATGSVPP